MLGETRQKHINFLEDNKGKCILIHGEYDLNPNQYDDGEWVYDTSNEEMYNQALETLEQTSHIHDVRVYTKAMPEGQVFHKIY